MTLVKISQKELGELLRKFKLEAYAGDGKYSDTPYGTKKYVCGRGIWRFTDEYAGDVVFSGVERLERVITLDKSIGICQMVYQGSVNPKTKIPSKKIFSFLKEALKALPVDYPFRGPDGRFISKKPEFEGFSYVNYIRQKRDLEFALGEEWIDSTGRRVYDGNWVYSLIMKKFDDVIIV